MDSKSISARAPRVKRPGIYSITGPTGKIYVGSTNNLPTRWSAHRCQLRDGIHTNPALQADYNRYGPTAFKFAILEECPDAQLDRQEQHWILTLDTDRTGYNVFTGYGLTRQGRAEEPTTAQSAWERAFGNKNS